MNRLHLAILSGLICFTGLAQANKASQKPMIVGGQEAVKGEFPFIVSLQDSSGHFCGGSLIKPDWVLTAGHCVDGTSLDKIVIGLHEQGVMTDTETMTVKKVISHPQFSRQTVDYDFALIQLSQKSHFQPVDISSVEMKNPGGSEPAINFVAAGWGALDQGSYSLAPKLMKVTVPLVEQKACVEAYKGFSEVTDRMICAGYEEGAKDACQGDSGGPMVLRDSTGQAKLVGVVSWGKGCAQPKAYGVYSRVSSVYDWVEKAAQ